MRKDFAKLLLAEMHNNKNIYLVTADLGYGLWDDIRDTFPTRFYNFGSSEMLALGACVGLAMDGKIPFFYSITPFAIYRPFEIIRNYLDHEMINVKIIGGGRGKDYSYLGFSHWAEEDRDVMSVFKHIDMYHPSCIDELKTQFNILVNNTKPTYINLKK
jgi:transketolase